MAAGVNIGIGVDAWECRNSTDMFESMEFGSYAQRAVLRDTAAGQARDLLRMATWNRPGR